MSEPLFHASPLPSRAVLSVGGEDARPFLQGLITNDIRKLSPASPLYAALLSPQGKFLHDFLLVEQAGEILLDTEAARVDELIARFTRYKLRSQVELALRPALAVGALWNSSFRHCEPKAKQSSLDHPELLRCARDDGGGVIYRDPRHEALGERFIYRNTETPPIPFNAVPKDYNVHRLALAIPEGDAVIERSFAAELGLEHLHGVDFAKGCYVGQEVTARSKYRGVLRKCLHRVESTESRPLPLPGTPILNETGNAVGEMRTSAGQQGLAIVRLSEDGQADPQFLVCNDIPVRATLPEWFPPPALNVV